MAERSAVQNKGHQEGGPHTPGRRTHKTNREGIPGPLTSTSMDVGHVNAHTHTHTHRTGHAPLALA